MTSIPAKELWRLVARHVDEYGGSDAAAREAVYATERGKALPVEPTGPVEPCPYGSHGRRPPQTAAPL